MLARALGLERPFACHHAGRIGGPTLDLEGSIARPALPIPDEKLIPITDEAYVLAEYVGEPLGVPGVGRRELARWLVVRRRDGLLGADRLRGAERRGDGVATLLGGSIGIACEDPVMVIAAGLRRPQGQLLARGWRRPGNDRRSCRVVIFDPPRLKIRGERHEVFKAVGAENACGWRFPGAQPVQPESIGMPARLGDLTKFVVMRRDGLAVVQTNKVHVIEPADIEKGVRPAAKARCHLPQARCLAGGRHRDGYGSVQHLRQVAPQKNVICIWGLLRARWHREVDHAHPPPVQERQRGGAVVLASGVTRRAIGFFILVGVGPENPARPPRDALKLDPVQRPGDKADDRPLGILGGQHEPIRHALDDDEVSPALRTQRGGIEHHRALGEALRGEAALCRIVRLKPAPMHGDKLPALAVHRDEQPIARRRPAHRP